MRKTVIVVANPFGYGPAGKALSIVEELHKRLKNDRVLFAGGEFVREIIDSGSEIVEVDERDERALTVIFKKIDNPYIVSSQNRFAVKVAKELELTAAFFDGLAWFWKTIPPDHLIADLIFWPRFPDMTKKIPPGHSIHFIGAIVEKTQRGITAEQKDDQSILLSVGGVKNPLTVEMPVAYLNLLADGLNYLQNTSLGKKRRIIVAGGHHALLYLKGKIINPNVCLKNLQHIDFLNLLERMPHLVTTGGQTATTEAFAMGIPVSFILPFNLSQYALVEVLKKHTAVSRFLQWSSYCDLPDNISDFSEGDAMIEFNRCAVEMNANEKLMDDYKKDFADLVLSTPLPTEQKKFIENVGVNGAKELVDTLISEWGLQ